MTGLIRLVTKVAVFVICIFLVLSSVGVYASLKIDGSLEGGSLNHDSSSLMNLPTISKNNERNLASGTPRAELVSFVNVTSEVGLSGINANFFAWGDYDNDGDSDLMVNGGRLFRNNGPPDFSFTEVSQDVGITGSRIG